MRLLHSKSVITQKRCASSSTSAAPADRVPESAPSVTPRVPSPLGFPRSRQVCFTLRQSKWRPVAFLLITRGPLAGIKHPRAVTRSAGLPRHNGIHIEDERRRFLASSSDEFLARLCSALGTDVDGDRAPNGPIMKGTSKKSVARLSS